ncbi:tyrosine-type recombinase/integrase [Tundrisphaera sp. TA3]|uniref:tyrosine-type recombinase/integrase n=1 Tax=Tundrisphaera sp. TA3 TaxID=3435775 RepID=UPI003EB7B33F
MQAVLKPSWSPSTTRSYIKTLVAALNLAIKNKRLRTNPLADVEKPAWGRRTQILSPSELDSLIAGAREPFLTLLKAMVGTGCRPSEICRLRIEDVNLTRGTWTVANKTAAQTGAATRTIYLPDDLIESCRSLIGVRTSGPLFLNRAGKPWSPDTIRLRFARLRSKLGLSEGAIPYGTRHRFASDAINVHKMDSLVVAKLMGHANPMMLAKTYFREDGDAMRDAVNRATSHRTKAAEG